MSHSHFFLQENDDVKMHCRSSYTQISSSGGGGPPSLGGSSSSLFYYAPMTVEISLKTADGHQMILENW